MMTCNEELVQLWLTANPVMAQSVKFAGRAGQAGLNLIFRRKGGGRR